MLMQMSDLKPQLKKLQELGISVCLTVMRDYWAEIEDDIGVPVSNMTDDKIQKFLLSKKCTNIDPITDEILELRLGDKLYSNYCTALEIHSSLADIIFGAETMLGVINQQQTDEQMMEDTVVFNRKKHKIRYISLDNVDIFSHTVRVAIGTEDLEKALIKAMDSKSETTRTKAQKIDDCIYFYVPNDMIDTPDEELIKFVTENVV